MLCFALFEASRLGGGGLFVESRRRGQLPFDVVGADRLQNLILAASACELLGTTGLLLLLGEVLPVWWGFGHL